VTARRRAHHNVTTQACARHSGLPSGSHAVIMAPCVVDLLLALPASGKKTATFRANAMKARRTGLLDDLAQNLLRVC